jgi:oligoribonuclease NrnB/cAMP/cGMP phosphodiesterase (DHH superfamily)
MSKFLERRKEDRKPTKDIVVLYHANCSDGFGGAWAAWKKFGRNANYIPVFHQHDPPEGLVDKEIYLVDFSYPEPLLDEMIEKNKRVTAIDHHESEKQITLKTQDGVYDVNHSGSVLAWKYFHPDKDVPLLLKYVEDIDLWKNEMPDTKEVFAYLDLYDFEFGAWNKLAQDVDERFDEVKEKGSFILQYQDKLIDRIFSRNAEIVEFEGIKTYAINSTDFRSEIGAMAVKALPPIAIIWYQRKNEIMISLRSDGTVDVSQLVKKYGGGGHVASAGFTLSIDKPLPWKDLSNE